MDRNGTSGVAVGFVLGAATAVAAALIMAGVGKPENRDRVLEGFRNLRGLLDDLAAISRGEPPARGAGAHRQTAATDGL